eukprot:Gb_35946 [translate_table: standard]
MMKTKNDGGTACIRYGWLIVICIFVLIRVDGYPHLHHDVSRTTFPPRFVFGTASASYQYEGAAREGGRGPSIWDTFSHTPGNTDDGSNGDVAVDEYHRYKEDVKLMKRMGVDAYRFSISWSRILPEGSLKGGINTEGIAYYNNLIDELLKNDIKPFVTLFHWDLPQALEDEYLGFLSANIVKDFAAYSELCFRAFGDRVKHWITLNEPLSIATQGYDLGAAAPGRCSSDIYRNCKAGNSATEPYIAAHNMLLSHAAAVRVYKRKYQASQNGSIGITLNSGWILPYRNTLSDKSAAERAMDFTFGWFMDPLTKGHYPSIMRDLVGRRLPTFSRRQSLRLKRSFDFIGLNYYTSNYAIHNPQQSNPLRTDFFLDSRVNLTSERDGVAIGPRAASTWLYVYPPGIGYLLNYTKNRYNNPTIFITENGIDEFNNNTLPLKEALNDTWRIDYFSKHLYHVREAIRDGSDVRGYFAWSLLDNFEWANGYTVRFGIHYVDYKHNLTRYPKASAHWFRKMLLNR